MVAKLINHSDDRKAFIDSCTYFDLLYYVNFFRIDVVESCLIATTACGIFKRKSWNFFTNGLLKEQFQKNQILACKFIQNFHFRLWFKIYRCKAKQEIRKGAKSYMRIDSSYDLTYVTKVISVPYSRPVCYDMRRYVMKS